jgi:SAM-dependent methyltransferase
VFRLAPQSRQRVEKLLWRAFYEAASLGRRDLGATLMNYGYAPTAGVAAVTPPGDDHYGLELYAAVAGAADLSGRDVLEVGCGRGGGTAFVFERFAPRSMTGLDLAARAIGRCRRRYARPGLSFVAGDAENLPFADESFDALLSVESTHCYSDTPRFLVEAGRVLRPGGLILLADFRHTTLPPEAEEALVPQEDLDRLRGQLRAAGFTTLEEEDITAGVVRALQLDTPRRRAQIERRVPRLLRRQALAFAAIEGGPMYEAFAERRWTYVRCVLEKSDA